MIKSWIENNFAIVLLLGGVLGFFAPAIENSISNNAVIILITALVYFACPSIKKSELLEVDIFHVGLFSFLRFAIFPILLFYIANAIVPEYAIGILLLSLMPAAMAVASLCMISGGKVALGISLTVISSLLTPVLVPGVFSFMGHYVDVNEFGLFLTLLIVIVAPFVLYFGATEKIQKHKNWLESNAKAASILCMGGILFMVIASYGDQFIESWELLFKGGFVMFILFGLFYGFGYIYGSFMPEGQQSAFTWASGGINNGLAIGLSFIYFSPETTFFVVISEIIWCIYVAAAQKYFIKQSA